MRNAVLVGIMIVSLAGFNQEIRAQGSWTPGPPGGIPIQPPCGEPTPNIQEPSPGDSTPCWEYKWSDGWVKLFECVRVTNCPSVSSEGGEGTGCACLRIGESANFTFAMPTWTVKPGAITNGPDNPDCGDPDVTPIEPTGLAWWTNEIEYASSLSRAIVRPVVTVEPRSGNGDAVFDITGQRAGECSVKVTWHYDLGMDSLIKCPSNFSIQGPIVDVCVYRIYKDVPETKSCPELIPIEYSDEGFGKVPEPELKDTLRPLQVCDQGGECEKWRITGGAYLELKEGWYRTNNKVISPDCSQQIGTLVPRTTAEIERTVDHEKHHCDKHRENIDDINDDYVIPAIQILYTTPGECKKAIRDLRTKIKDEWRKRYWKNKYHCYHESYDKYIETGCGGEKYSRKYRCGDW